MSRKALFTDGLIPALLDAAYRAGALIMAHYRQGRAVDVKADASPVTAADKEADMLIVAALQVVSPFPAVSEEGAKPDVGNAEYFWLVDPIDGTKSFIRGTGYFTVNIALIRRRRLTGEGIPVLGIIYDPVNDVMYWGSGAGAFRMGRKGEAETIHTRARPKQTAAAYISHTHISAETEAYLAAHGIGERIPCASSIKFCFLAEGKADFYPRFGPTMEWDTAAGHAIVIAAGGSMTTLEGAPFVYGKPGFLNGGFVAAGE